MSRNRWQLVSAVLATLFAFTSTNAAAQKIGVVLMHGKGGLPNQMVPLADALSAAGYLTENPEMCWSRNRNYDRPYLDCLGAIDSAAARLRARGATAIVVAGMSLGGNAALAYGARHGEIKAVVAIAAAHNPERLINRPSIQKSVAEARQMVSSGRGDSRATFTDVNHGKEFTIQTTARIYLSFFDPGGPAATPPNTARVKAPLLWVAGTSDPTQQGPGYAFAKASNPKNKYVTVPADHMGTLRFSHDAVLAWLRTL